MSKDHVAGLAIQIPEELINQVVIAEVAKALPGADSIVEQVVRAALATRKDSYSKETIFESRVKEMIRDTCEKVFSEWLSSNRAKIHDALMRNLNKNKQKVLKTLVDRMANGMADLSVYGVSVKIADDE